MIRHLHSLRRMERDHGWIHTLLEVIVWYMIEILQLTYHPSQLLWNFVVYIQLCEGLVLPFAISEWVAQSKVQGRREGGNRNWGDLFKGFASFYFICLIYHQRYLIIISNTYCKRCLMWIFRRQKTRGCTWWPSFKWVFKHNAINIFYQSLKLRISKTIVNQKDAFSSNHDIFISTAASPWAPL